MLDNLLRNPSADPQAPAITYFTPRLSGLQAGIGYGNQAQGSDSSLALQLGYRSYLGLVDLDLASHYSADLGSTNRNGSTWDIGLNLSSRGFRLGGRYGEVTDNTLIGSATGYGLHLDYQAETWSLGAGWRRSDYPAGGQGSLSLGDGQQETVRLFGEITLAPGVSVTSGAGYLTFDDSSGQREDDAGLYVISGFEVDF